MAICFVILPFGKTTDKHDAKYWEDHFEKFIKPAIEKAADGQQLLGYEARLANPPGGGIIENVFKNLQDYVNIKNECRKCQSALSPKQL